MAKEIERVKHMPDEWIQTQGDNIEKDHVNAGVELDEHQEPADHNCNANPKTSNVFVTNALTIVRN